MSRHPSRDRSITIVEGDSLAVIREEQTSDLSTNANPSGIVSKTESKENETELPPCKTCVNATHTPEEIEKMLAKREAELRAEFDKELKSEIKSMTDRFDYILKNEQVRASYMLREAHRDRKEKVQALQTQLECKNLTGLMYVLCAERRKSKMEKLRIIEEYTKYIHTLQDILTEGQLLILHLSRGYKTAARVDHEWREKMKSIIKEFQEYVYHFAGGTPESNQYVFDVPALLRTETAIVDDPEEDPCTCEEELPVKEEEEVLREKTWWEMLDSECRPFVMFGDMEEFSPPKRREVVAIAKAAAAKTAPPKWKEYVFNDMLLKSNCPHADVIKDEYPSHLPLDKWECRPQYHHLESETTMTREQSSPRNSSRRPTANSVDARSMGSILKIITSSNITHHPLPAVKTNLLAARDSMEIASTTKLRKVNGYSNGTTSKNVSICIARTKSPPNIVSEEMEMLAEEGSLDEELAPKEGSSEMRRTTESDEEVNDGLGSIHQDSLQVINSHKPDVDHAINYEKICPMDQCQRMQMDSFIRALPAYMRASPFTFFEQSFADYETCSPEQLEILKQRLDVKRKSNIHQEDSQSLSDFEQEVEGVATQTSEELITGLPPCTCKVPEPSAASSTTRVFRVEDLLPMKEALDEITEECFHNHRILFDRFEVVGQEKGNTRERDRARSEKGDFKKQRVEEIKNILRQHPSMLDLFQPNPRC